MQILEITDKEQWDRFLGEVKPNTFLQSWQWGQVQKRTGENIRYLGFYEGQQLQGVALVITVNARRGKFFLIPHGPIIQSPLPLKTAVAELVAYAKENATKEQVAALRIAPLTETSPESVAVFSEAGFRPAPLHIHAELTWVLSIYKSEEEILAGMRKTTRHAIKKAQQANVQVEIVTDIQTGLDRFWPLYETTKDRHGFVPFSRSFLQTQAEEFSKENNMFFVIASHDGKDVAGAMLMHFGDTVFYYHGASLKLSTSIPAAQLLQWETIKEAERRGATQYNFWGIAPDNEPNHPFAGITTFKKGFGGYAIDYLHAQDLPLSFGYWKMWLIDMWRKKRRGF
ncbi:MAG: peptidoglycan bridge formation glycyltransferase FemA/FemB family protein [Candidatus Andersenbacteria bacterium]|nr:peptidoglycan bridge formation glycyltransferase FemA/FemB family protein [Candidatus Andersenbacteria bacterium]MBI3250297.1 peptidoglycan bridge formation glycyltransferase FemA/FemB family protein [Candidatus Andersenbacteria bacterium]